MKPDPPAASPSDPEPKAAPRAGFWRTFLKVEVASVRLMSLFLTPWVAFVCGIMGGMLLFSPVAVDWEGAWLAFDMVVRVCGVLFATCLISTVPVAALIGWGRFRNPEAFRNRPWRWFAGMPRRRRGAWLVGLPIVASAAGLTVAAWTVRTVQDRLDAAMAVAALDDPFWRLDDILAYREEIPDEENAALVVNEAAMELPDSWPWQPGREGLPSLWLPEPERALEAILLAEPNRRIDDATLALVQAITVEFSDAVEIARELVDYDIGSHEINISETVLNTPLPETFAVTAVSHLLNLDVTALAADELLDEAIDSCRAMFVASRSIGDEPFMISQLVRNSVGRSAVRAVQRVLGQGEVPEESLSYLLYDVVNDLDEPWLLYALRGERALIDELIRRIQYGELPIRALGNERALTSLPSNRLPWVWALLGNQRAIELQLMNVAVAVGQLPPAKQEPYWALIDEAVGEFKEYRLQSFLFAIPAEMTIDVRPMSRSTHDYKAELGALALLIAAERQRLESGEWPKSAADIDPEILADPPLDPFSDEPYRFQYSEGRLRIYSVGANGIDEQGEYNINHYTKGGPDDAGVRAWDVKLRGLPASSPEGKPLQSEADRSDQNHDPMDERAGASGTGAE